MSVCGWTFFAKGSESGSRIQHRDSCSAALPKPASWRYRQTVCEVRDGRHGAWYRAKGCVGKGTEIVHHIAAEQRHDIISDAGNVIGAAGVGRGNGAWVARLSMGTKSKE
jgi:hypothetical protein